ncbi:MAG: 3'-5' exonuclease, partial [Pirellulaceae bacterium]
RLAPHCDRRDQSRLQQLVELAYEYQPASTLRTRDFLALAESKKIADPSSADVRVMTIHQAKGLEFDIVVLPELDKRLVGQPDSLVTGRAGPTQPIEVVCRYTNENVRRFLPQPLQALFDDEVRREVAEAMCVLYVAMTRAVHCLHMILTPPKANEKSLPKTFAGLLRASLAESEQRPTAGIVFEHGDAAWFERLPARTVCNAPPCDELPATIRLAPPLAQRDRGLERTSPSALEGGSRFNLARLLERNRFALEQGTLVHAWLERLAWLDDGSPDDAALRAVAARLAPDLAANTAALGERLDTFRKQLAHKPIAAVLRRSFYDDPQQLGLADAAAIGWQAGEVQLQVQSERTFALRDGDEILVGSIDRLVLVRRGGRLIAADIIDFKTDELPPRDAAALADKVAFYQPQIEAYRKAAARLLRLDPRRIAARLVFLGAGKVCPVPAAQ